MTEIYYFTRSIDNYINISVQIVLDTNVLSANIFNVFYIIV